MRKIILLFILSLFSITVHAQQKKVAVYVTGEDASINKVLGSKLISAIARSEQYTAIERTDAILAELSKELKYQQTGAVDDDELSRLGKQFGVQYVCVASVFTAFNEQYISARLIDVETAQVERSASSSGAINSLDGLISAANVLSRDLLSNLGNDKQKNVKKVAVYVVSNDSGKEIGRVLGDKLVAGFTNSGRYVAVERSNSFLTQLSKEQEYQRTGAVDDHDISRIGRQFGVQYVCVADVTDVFGEKFISARLIDVETAETVNSFEIGGQLKTMGDCLMMTKEIASNLSKGTFAEQAEEARMRAAEEARVKAEEERIKEEKERLERQKNEEEARRREQEAIDNLKNRPWRELLSKVTTNVTKRYDSGCYIGDYSGGKRYGTALYCWDDGTLYCGFYDNGDFNGYGMYIVPDGNWEISNCPDGWAYVGEWKDSKKQGKGSVYDRSGKLIHFGNFLNGKPIGINKHKYPDSEGFSKYTFQVINFENGDKYIGELENGQKSGVGLYIWENGDAWYGHWSEDRRNGRGIFMLYDGRFIKGTWANDVLK